MCKDIEKRLEHIEGVQLSPIQKDVVSNYAYFPVVFWEEAFGTGRDEVKQKLGDSNIGARKYFYPLTSSFACYGRTIFRKQSSGGKENKRQGADITFVCGSFIGRSGPDLRYYC